EAWRKEEGPLRRAAPLIPVVVTQRSISVARYDRATPIEVVVDADPHDVFEERRPVVEDRAEAPGGRRAGGRNGASGRQGVHHYVLALHADEEVPRFDRPAGRDHPREAAAPGEAPRFLGGALVRAKRAADRGRTRRAVGI